MDETSVFVNVARNLNAPKFTRGNFYNISFSENKEIGSEVIKLEATDALQGGNLH